MGLRKTPQHQDSPNQFENLKIIDFLNLVDAVKYGFFADKSHLLKNRIKELGLDNLFKVVKSKIKDSKSCYLVFRNIIATKEDIKNLIKIFGIFENYKIGNYSTLKILINIIKNLGFGDRTEDILSELQKMTQIERLTKTISKISHKINSQLDNLD